MYTVADVLYSLQVSHYYNSYYNPAIHFLWHTKICKLKNKNLRSTKRKVVIGW